MKISYIILAFISVQVHATNNLPFVGTRYYNFMGGSGTTNSITLKKDGSAIIKIHGTVSTGTIYKGKFQNPLNMGKQSGYLKFSKNNVELLDDNKQGIYECDEIGRIGYGKGKCIQKLEKEL